PEVSYQKPKPVYRWQYRPEFQYSIYGLNIQELTLHAEDKSEGTDLLNSQTPVISSSDDLIALVYNLDIINYLPLDYFNSGEEKELIFAFGEHEVKAKINERDRVEFTNLDHLASLDPEDFLTIQLYTNNDAGNVLWEYAFFALSISLAEDHELIGNNKAYVYADDPTIDLLAVLLGYNSLTDSQRRSAPEVVQWRIVEGQAGINPVTAPLGDNGIALTTVSLHPTAGNNVRVEAVLQSDQTASAQSFEIEVLAGKPNSISLSTQGTAYLKSVGSVLVEAVVTDQFGNLVEDGTPVMFREHGHINLKSYQGFTSGGKVSAIVSGGSVSGSYNLKVRAGDAESATQINVAPLQ